MATLILVIIGGIYLSSYLPRRPSLAPAIALAVVAGALLLWNVITLSRLRAFAWDTFFLVGRWALAAYAVVAGMLEYIFALDHTPGGMLVLLTLMLAIFAVNIPLLLAFSVARHQAVAEEG